jgi:hypothetical protein
VSDTAKCARTHCTAVITTEEAVDYTYSDIAKMIDHSLLRPFYNDEELEAGCQLALDYDVASVCIKPYYLKRAAAVLAGSDVKATTTTLHSKMAVVREMRPQKRTEICQALRGRLAHVDSY